MLFSRSQTSTYPPFSPVFHMLLPFQLVFLSLRSHLHKNIFHVFISPLLASSVSCLWFFVLQSALSPITLPQEKNFASALQTLLKGTEKSNAGMGSAAMKCIPQDKGSFYPCQVAVKGGNCYKPAVPLGAGSIISLKY